MRRTREVPLETIPEGTTVASAHTLQITANEKIRTEPTDFSYFIDIQSPEKYD
jgi:hypothetical protein